MARPMKHSDVEWLGDIPDDWKIGRIGQLYTERREKVSDIDFPPLSVTMKGILPQLSSAAKSDAHDDRKLVRKGDFAINSRSDRRGSCGTSPFDGSVSLINTILTPREGMHPLYYDWLFHSTMFADEFYKWGHGIVDDLWTTNWQDMKKIFVPVPPIEEQQRIAAYLDDKCARIDSVISKTRATVAEYKKLKQAIITRAVTRGIRPDRPLKHSGIDWLGQIPADWKIVQLKRFVHVNNGREVPTEINQCEGAIPVYGSGGIFKYTNTFLYDGETVMFGRKGTLGKPVYANEKFWTVDTMYYLTFSNELFAKFNYYQLVAFDWEPHITQTALPSIVASEIVSCKFAFPPIDEQREIAAYLDAKTAEIDSLVAKKIRLAEDLEQLKKSLIFEYVTGKKEVEQ